MNTRPERRSLHERIAVEYRPEPCALMQETDAGISTVLTAAQADTFAQLKADRRERFAGHWGHGMPGIDCDEAQN